MSVAPITLCMIVKNEEQAVAAALESARPVVDDMVVVDTGSSDGTAAVAGKYTSRIYSFEWSDDFAAARNFAMEHVRTPWILWLDADEQLAVVDGERWRRSFAQKSRAADALLVTIHNYYGPVASELNMHLYGGFRLLRTGANLRYRQRIHEHLDVSRPGLRLDHEPVDGVVIRHYGYMDDPARKKEKSARNRRLLERERERPDYDPWIDYHLAVEHYRQGEHAAAFECVQRSLKRFLEKGKLPPPLAYKLKYELLLVTGSTRHALEGIEYAIRLYPDYVDLYYCKGLFEYGQGRYEDALNTFNKCLELGEKPRYLTLKGTGSFLASYMVGMCLEALGQPAQARAVYAELVRRFPAFEPPAARLAALQHGTEGA